MQSGPDLNQMGSGPALTFIGHQVGATGAEECVSGVTTGDVSCWCEAHGAAAPVAAVRVQTGSGCPVLT